MSGFASFDKLKNVYFLHYLIAGSSATDSVRVLLLSPRRRRNKLYYLCNNVENIYFLPNPSFLKLLFQRLEWMKMWLKRICWKGINIKAKRIYNYISGVGFFLKRHVCHLFHNTIFSWINFKSGQNLIDS